MAVPGEEEEEESSEGDTVNPEMRILLGGRGDLHWSIPPPLPPTSSPPRGGEDVAEEEVVVWTSVDGMVLAVVKVLLTGN